MKEKYKHTQEELNVAWKQMKKDAKKFREHLASIPGGLELLGKASKHPVFQSEKLPKPVELTEEEVKIMIENDNYWIEEMKKIGIK